MGEPKKSFSERPIRIGGYYLTIGEWGQFIGGLTFAPFIGGYIGKFFIWFGLGIFGFEPEFENFFSFDIPYWIGFAFYMLVMGLNSLKNAKLDTKYNEQNDRDEERKKSPEYQFKIKHIESLREKIGDYEADKMIKEVLRGKE